MRRAPRLFLHETPRGWLSAPPNQGGLCSRIPVAVRRECDHSAATLWRAAEVPAGIRVWRAPRVAATSEFAVQSRRNGFPIPSLTSAGLSRPCHLKTGDQLDIALKNGAHFGQCGALRPIGMRELVPFGCQLLPSPLLIAHAMLEDRRIPRCRVAASLRELKGGNRPPERALTWVQAWVRAEAPARRG